MLYNYQSRLRTKIITKYGGTTNPRKSKLGLSLDINRLRFYAVCFIVCLSRRLSKYIEKKMLTTCFYLEKRRPLVSMRDFLHDFSKFYFLRYILLTDQFSLPDWLYVAQYLYCNWLFTLVVSSLTLAFWSSGFPSRPKQSGQKSNYLKNKTSF